MKVALVVGSLRMGGAQRVAVNLADAWVRKGWEVSIIVTYAGHGGSYYPLHPQVRVLYLADLVRADAWRGWNRVARLLALRRAIELLQADAVISLLTDANLAVLLALAGRRRPCIVSERAYPPRDPVGRLYDALRRWTYPRADVVVMQTQRGLDWLRQAIPKARGCVIPNPVVHPLPPGGAAVDVSSHVAAHERLVLAVGRLADQKGFDMLVDAFAAVAATYPDWRLVILGEGPARAKLEAQVRTLGLQASVSLPGAAGNLAAWYQRADLFVLSSRAEGFPNTLTEAMACGCACVAFDCDTGPAEIIDDGRDGVLVPLAGGAAALASALQRLLGDPALRQSLGQQAVGVRARFAPDAVLAQWEAQIDAARAAHGARVDRVGGRAP